MARADDRVKDVMPALDELRTSGVTSLNALAKALREQEIPKARGGYGWTATDVRNLLARAG